MKRALLFLVFVFLFYGLKAQVPSNYYDGTQGLSGTDLLQKLHDIITNGHTPITYTDIWTAFAKTDTRPGTDTIWDMYSDVPGGTAPYYFILGNDQCGTYSQEGDCYNREHSFPKSWWGGTEDVQYTDLNHIFATDGYVNSRRSNYPYGDVGSATWTSLNGSMLGQCDKPDYSGTVFEPIDEYKGDVARALFYMATRYKDEIPTWVADYASTTDIDVVFQANGQFQPWYYSMMYQWHLDDPVSDKELRRNDSVYNIQGNANPFIDHPEFVCLTFGNLFVDDPQNFSATAPADNQVDLSWALNSNGDQVMLAYSTDGFFGMPNGTYSAGDNIQGGGTVLYVGTNTSFSHTGLTTGQKYYYKLWSIDAQGRYSCGVLADATPGGSSNTGTTTGQCASDLFISEYAEGTSYNKYIEIYNGTGLDVNLADYSLEIYSNGGTSPTYTITLNSITLPSGSVYIIANSQASATILNAADQTTGSLSYNGNDAIVLKHNTTAIDQIGIVGQDPGVAWDVAGVTDATAEHTLVRKSSVNDGTTDWATSAGTDADNSQWIVYAQDFWDSLGTHTMVCPACSEPTQAATNPQIDAYTSTTITISWTNGDGEYRLVLAKQGANVDAEPADGTAYNADNQFGSGDQIGTGNYVVYSGTGNTVTVTGLTPGTTYYFKIFEYNCTGTSSDYLTTNAPEISQLTKPDKIDDLDVVCADNTSIELSWTAPSGNYDGIIVTALEGSTPPVPTCDPSTLTENNPDYPAAPVYCSNADNAKYVYNSTGTSVTVTGLTTGATYHFIAYTYKNSQWSAAGNEVIQIAKLYDVTDLYAVCGDGHTDLSWTNPQAGCFDEVMVAVSENPVNATPSGTYTANSTDYTDASNPTLSDGSVVVYNGTGENITVTGLTNGTLYYFKVFVRKGTQWSAGTSTSCTPTAATVLEPGDLMIVSVNTDYYDTDSRSDDEIEFVCFKDITPGTSIDFTDNGYERLTAGLWGDTEGVIRFTRKAGTPIIPAGTLIKIRGEGGGVTPELGTDWNIWVGGTLDNDNWTAQNLDVVGLNVGQFNLNEDDQVWIMQGGDWLTNDTWGDHDDQYTGNILYGWTAIGWEPAPGYNSTSGSTLYPGNECSTTNLNNITNGSKVTYTGDTSIASHREWIARLNNPANWTGFSTTADYENGKIMPDKIRISGEGFTQTWIGNEDENWFNCGNWGNLQVPDENADVTFDAENAQNNIVFQDGDTAVCKSLTITGTTPNFAIKAEGTPKTVIKILGDLNINLPNALDLNDDDPSSIDAKIIISGNWNNNAGANGIDLGNNTIVFNGTNQQTINNSGGSQTFYKLYVSNSAGVVMNADLTVNDTLTLDNGILDLNGKNLTINGTFVNQNGSFTGDQASNLTLDGSGSLGDLAFSTDFNLANLTLNRNGQLNIITDLYIQNDLNINAGQVTLAPGKFYTVSGTLNNSTGNNGLILKSNSIGTASLITNTQNLQAICQRYLSKNVWHYIFVPLSAVPADSLRITSWGEQNPNFYWYDETIDDYWWADGYCTSTNGWTSVSNSTLDDTKGYIFYSTENRIYELTGGYLHVTDYTFNLSYTGYTPTTVTVCDGNNTQMDRSNFDGWNLIGNPFTAAIDWDNSGITFNNVENVIYYYDGSTGNYKYYRPASSTGQIYDQGITVNGGTRYVPANQAFMIKAAGSNASITIPASARVHNSQAFLKQQTEAPDIIRLEINNGSLTDETVIQINPLTTNTFDTKYDARKLFSINPYLPQIFTIDENNQVYAINTIPETGKTIPLGIKIPEIGYYSISLKSLTLPGTRIYLKDSTLKKTVFLNLEPAYDFYAEKGLDYNRFKLIFSPNHPPVVSEKLNDLTLLQNQQFSFQIPSSVFNDPDSNETLTVTIDTTTLPGWIKTDKLTISGTALDTGTFEITLLATDMFGETASTQFKLIVKPNTGETTSDIQIYPNPVKTYLTISLPNAGDYIIEVLTVNGRKILSLKPDQTVNLINTKNWTSGTYLIKIITPQGTVTRKVIKL